MLSNTLSLVLAAAALTSAIAPGREGKENENFFRNGKRRVPALVDEEGTTTASPTGDCAITYADLTITNVLTQVVDVWEASTVYEEPCPTSTVITSGDSVTTSYYTLTSTITSTYMSTATVDAPGDNPPPPSTHEPVTTSGKVAPPPYRVPRGNDTSVLPSGSSAAPPPPVATCPAVWRQIGQEMMGAFAGCNRPARSSIRFAFHDAGRAL